MAILTRAPIVSTQTCEEMESDINAKFEQLADELDVTDEYQEASGSQTEVQ